MIDPTNITKFDRTESELEEFLLFCILVAGKNSNVQAKKLEEFLQHALISIMSPFEQIKDIHSNKSTDLLMYWIKRCKLGQYRRIWKCFTQLLSLQGKLSTCTIDDLEAIYGIGPKTGRFFLTHTRPNQSFGVLDVHLLRHMREDLGIPTPKQTPSSKRQYEKLEAKLLQEVKRSGKTTAEYDLDIWKKYSEKASLSS